MTSRGRRRRARAVGAGGFWPRRAGSERGAVRGFRQRLLLLQHRRSSPAPRVLRGAGACPLPHAPQPGGPGLHREPERVTAPWSQTRALNHRRAGPGRWCRAVPVTSPCVTRAIPQSCLGRCALGRGLGPVLAQHPFIECSAVHGVIALLKSFVFSRSHCELGFVVG